MVNTYLYSFIEIKYTNEKSTHVPRGWHSSLKYAIIKKYEYKQCFNNNNYKIEVDINETYLYIKDL